MSLIAPTALVIGRLLRLPTNFIDTSDPSNTNVKIVLPRNLNYSASLTWQNTETRNHWVRVTVQDGTATRTTDFARGSTSTGTMQIFLTSWAATEDQLSSRTITVSVKLMSATEESASVSVAVPISLLEDRSLSGAFAYDDDGQLTLPTTSGTMARHYGSFSPGFHIPFGIGFFLGPFDSYAYLVHEPLPFVPEIVAPYSDANSESSRVPRRLISADDTIVRREDLQRGSLGLQDKQSYRTTLAAALVTPPVVASRRIWQSFVQATVYTQWYKVETKSDAYEYYYRTSFEPDVSDESVQVFDGAEFTYQISATNRPTSYAASGLSPGLSVNATTGRISGTINESAVLGGAGASQPNSTTRSVTIQATNATGTGSGRLALVVNNPRPVVTSGAIETNVDIPINYNLAVSDPFSNVRPTGLTVAFGSALPNLSFARNATGGGGVISGTVNTAGNYSITVTATNTYGSRNSTIALNVRPFTASNVSINVLRNTPIRQLLAPTHPATWEIVAPVSNSSIPPGFGFEYEPAFFGTATGPDRAFLVGTPVAAGVYTFQIKATRAGYPDQTVFPIVTLTVRDVPLPNLVIGGNADIIQNGLTVERGSNVSLAFTSNPSPAAWEANGLPPGLSHQNGLISGEATANGTYSISLSAQADGYNKGTVGIRITVVEPPTPPPPPPPLSGATPETRSPWLLKQWLLTDLSIYARSRVVQSTFFDSQGALRIKLGDDMSFAIMFIDQDNTVFAMKPDELKLTIRKKDNLDDLIIFKSSSPPESAENI